MYQPQILRKIFENHLPPRKKYKNQTIVKLLEFVKLQCSHLDSLSMWQMVRTKHIFHQKYQSFTLFYLCKDDSKSPPTPVRNSKYLAIPPTLLPLRNIKMVPRFTAKICYWNGFLQELRIPNVFFFSLELICSWLQPTGINKIECDLLCNILSHAQSICTHNFCFENMGRFVTLKKIKSKIWVAKSRVQKNRVIVIQKEKRPGCLFSLWLKWPCFLHPAFRNPYFGCFFLKFQSLKKYQVDVIN